MMQGPDLRALVNLIQTHTSPFSPLPSAAHSSSTPDLAAVVPPFRRSAGPPFRRPSVPSFRRSAVPLFRRSAVPLGAAAVLLCVRADTLREPLTSAYSVPLSLH